MKGLTILAAALALCAPALAACGGDDEASANCGPAEASGNDINPATDTLEVSAPANNDFVFDQGCLDATPGIVTATFHNPAELSHDFCIEDSGGEELGCTELIADGDTDTLQVELEEGEYTFYCSVAGHREDGMEGELTVRE